MNTTTTTTIVTITTTTTIGYSAATVAKLVTASAIQVIIGRR